MLSSVKWCAEPIPQSCRFQVKVAVEGHEFELLILCPLHFSFTPGRISIKFWSTACLSKTLCRTHDTTCWLKVKVTIRSRPVCALALIAKIMAVQIDLGLRHSYMPKGRFCQPAAHLCHNRIFSLFSAAISWWFIFIVGRLCIFMYPGIRDFSISKSIN